MSDSLWPHHAGLPKVLDVPAPVHPASTQAAPVCPNPENQSPSEWAEKSLNFKPNPKQAEVLDAADRFLILCCNRQWGKTTTIAIKALHRALARPDQSLVIISRTKLQAGILIDRATDFAIRLGIRTRRVLGRDFSLKLPNGSRIFAVAHSGDTSVGNTANVLIVDEAALVSDHVYWAVAPFVARTRGDIWLLSTPRRQAGFFYNIWHDLSAPWRRVFSSIADCPELDPEYLEMQKLADPIRFRQDFLCEFTQPADRLVSREILDRMIDPSIDQWQIPRSFSGKKPDPAKPYNR